MAVAQRESNVSQDKFFPRGVTLMRHSHVAATKWSLRWLRSLEYKVDPAPVTCVGVSLSRRYILSGDAKGRLYGWM